MGDAIIRPMLPADAPAAVTIVRDAFRDADERAGRDTPEWDEERLAWVVATVRRFSTIDPETCFIAEVAGAPVGMAVAIRRGSFWGLAQLFVHPDQQGSGIGRQLLEATLAASQQATLAMIIASEDPRAIRSYATAGLDLHPAVQVSGTVDRSALPASSSIRAGDASDLELVDDVDQRLRGSSRRPDVEFLLGREVQLLVADGRGYAVARKGSPLMLGADSEQTARDLLWAALAGAGEEEVNGYCWTASQRWAIDVALQARLAVKPGGPLFIRGAPQPPGPWLPSGIYF